MFCFHKVSSHSGCSKARLRQQQSSWAKRACVADDHLGGMRSVDWLEVLDQPSIDATPGTTILPVFPLTAIEWPGSTAQLNIIDPAYRRMYDDILMSGARRFMVTFTKSLPGGRVRYAEMPQEDRRLHAVGSVLYLDDLKEVSERTGGTVKYQAKHTVNGRARLLRLLNPSALFRTDSNGNKIDYLRAEVEFLNDTALVDEARCSRNMGTLANLWTLAKLWGDLFQLYNQAYGLRMDGGELTGESMAKSSSWRLAEFWQDMQSTVLLQREQMRVHGEFQEWVRTQQQQQPRDLDEMLKQLPQPLFEAIQRVNSGGGDIIAESNLWEQLLLILSESTEDSRCMSLVKMAQTEIRLARAAVSLKDVLDDESS